MGCCVSVFEAQVHMKIHVVSCGRNHHAFANQSVCSVLEQGLPEDVELRYTWVDDASDPPVFGGLESQTEMVVVRKPVRCGALANFYREALRHIEPDTVVFPLGGDDYLLGLLDLPEAGVTEAEIYTELRRRGYSDRQARILISQERASRKKGIGGGIVE